MDEYIPLIVLVIFLILATVVQSYRYVEKELDFIFATLSLGLLGLPIWGWLVMILLAILKTLEDLGLKKE